MSALGLSGLSVDYKAVADPMSPRLPAAITKGTKLS
jgi:hypothetical protein